MFLKITVIPRDIFGKNNFFLELFLYFYPDF